MVVGFIPATVLILLNAFLNIVTINLQIKTKERYGNRVKSMSDLGKACFGHLGYVVFAATILCNQVLTCIAYIMFFMQQAQQVLSHLGTEDNDP
jgi:amino acid permease